MTFERILYTVEDGVGVITMNRPEKRNAIDGLLIEELKTVLTASRIDDAVKVLTLAGAGKDFCSGADLANLERVRHLGVMANLEDARGLADLFLQMRRHPKLIIALVTGRALAGGCGLATACDFILAEEFATFGYPEINIGFVPAIVMAILKRTVPEKLALELITSGDPITAIQAKNLGLINQIFPQSEFEHAAYLFVKKYTTRSSSALTLCKSLLYHMDTLLFEAAIEAGVHVNGIARMTDDCQSGIDRFLQKSQGV